MKTLINILLLIGWVLGTYLFWMLMHHFTDLTESQGDLYGEDLDKIDSTKL